MRRSWGVLLVLTVLVAVPVGVAAPATRTVPTGPDGLRADLDEILADPRLNGAHAGVVVRDPATDEVLYSRQADARTTPASNAKVLTAAAALDTLGPEHRFRTDVLTAAPQHGPLLAGDLHLRGNGDPTVQAADYDRLAAQVAAAGVRVVQGRLLTDDTWFEDKPLGSGWAWDDEPYYYAAPVSALTVAPNTDYDAGSVRVRVEPGAEGRPPAVRLDPFTDAVRIDNRATTSAPGTEPGLSVRREHGGQRVLVTGSVPAGSGPVEEFISVPDPSAYAADVFTRALAAHGVSVSGTAAAPVPEDARTLAARDSMPLRELLVPFLKLSNNGHAEVLVKSMGRAARGAGSWEAGIEVLGEKLDDLGVDSRALRMVDGSGLSEMDSVTPGQLVSVLDNAKQRPWFRQWYDALPVAGVPDRMLGGTLRGRMRGTPAENNVHAKTGSILGVSALSGYVTAADGRELVFSVVFNDFLSEAPQDLEDAIAVRLAEYGATERTKGAPGVPAQREPADDPGTVRDESALECSWVKAC